MTLLLLLLLILLLKSLPIDLFLSVPEEALFVNKGDGVLEIGVLCLNTQSLILPLLKEAFLPVPRLHLPQLFLHHLLCLFPEPFLLLLLRHSLINFSLLLQEQVLIQNLVVVES